jgi:Protein of unknown function (DUF3347)
MRLKHIIGICAIAPMASCGNDTANSNSAPATATQQAVVSRPAPSSKLNDAGTHLLTDMVAKYYGLKNALVNTKADDAATAANQLITAADSLNAFAHRDSMAAGITVYLDTVIAQSKAMTGINDNTCEHQRIAFAPVSSAIYGLLKKVELKNGGIYHEYCPMAFNEKGAFWLSAETEIKNPYFGKKMMECGEVTDSL